MTFFNAHTDASKGKKNLYIVLFYVIIHEHNKAS